MRIHDTLPEAEKIQIAAIRRMNPEERLKAAVDLCRMSRQLLSEGVRNRHPEYSAEEIRLATIRLILPEHIFACVYPEAGEIQP